MRTPDPLKSASEFARQATTLGPRTKPNAVEKTGTPREAKTASRKPYSMMFLHRTFGIVVVLVLFYIPLTGTLIQLADLRALVSHAPAADPDMQDIRVHANGPPNYAVLSLPDYTAPALPATLDYTESFARIAALAHAAAPGAPLRLIELRMAEGKPAGHVQVGAEHLIFDLTSGAPLPAADLPPVNPGKLVPSARETFKAFHRFMFMSRWGVAVNVVAGLVFGLMVFTGLVHYCRLYASRHKQGRGGLLWRAGGWWRDLHRWLSVVAGIFVIVLVVSGFALAINCLGQDLNTRATRAPSGAIPSAQALPPPDSGIAAVTHTSFSRLFYWVHGPISDAIPSDKASSPLRDSELAAMTYTTLSAFHNAMPGTAIKVLRLRYFAGYPQGIVITAGQDTTQFVFNAVTGHAMSETEPGYPSTGFPVGWQAYQWLKAIHSGEMFGMSGRSFETLGGFAMVYLSVSGIVMYYRMWVRRRRNGRQALFWR